MPKGQLYINDVDMFEEYGVSMDNNALSTLMQYPERKEFIKNESRNGDGTQYVLTNLPPLKEREITLTFHMYANSDSQFLSRYNAFQELLLSGKIRLRTSFQSDVEYRLLYISCTQFTQFRREYASIGVKFIEYNPANRAL